MPRLRSIPVRLLLSTVLLPLSLRASTRVGELDRLGELGVEVIVFDQCANSREAGDYLSVMRENAENPATAFGR